MFEEFINAAKSGDLKKIQEFLKEHIDIINKQDAEGYTALMHACANNQYEVAEYLLQMGADPHIASFKAEIPFYRKKDRLDGSDEEYLNIYGYTQFNYDYCMGIPERVTVESNRVGLTALMLAARICSIKLLLLLLDYGADPNQSVGVFENFLSWLWVYSGYTFSPFITQVKWVGVGDDEVKLKLELIQQSFTAVETSKEIARVLYRESRFPGNIIDIVQDYENDPSEKLQPLSIKFSREKSQKFQLLYGDFIEDLSKQFQPLYRNFSREKQLFIHTLASKTQLLGDRHHALGLQRALASTYCNPRIVHDWDPGNSTEYAAFISMLRSANKDQTHVIIAVGNIGLQCLPPLKADLSLKDKIVIVWSGHQYVTELNDKLQHFDIVGLPQHDRDLITHPQVFSAYGVPHDATPEILKLKYEQFQKEFEQDKEYVVVVMGGDAPDRANQVHPFTAKSAAGFATALGHSIKSFKKPDSKILVTTGPRTSSEAIKAFNEALLAAGIAAEQIKILEFNAGFKGASFAALEFLRQHGNKGANESQLFVTADSITMATAALETQQMGTVTLVEIDSMSDSHKRFITHCYAAGLSHCWRTLDDKYIKQYLTKGHYFETEQYLSKARKVEDIVAGPLRQKLDFCLRKRSIEQVEREKVERQAEIQTDKEGDQSEKQIFRKFE